MSDQSFFLPLADVRQEVQRLATVHQNECLPYGVPSVEAILGGTHARWQGGAWLECQEAPLADGTYAIRVRWWRPGMPEPCAQSWVLSPWCAPANGVTFPGELVRGETRASVGELTWAQIRDQGLTCDRHRAKRVWCGCRAGQGGLSTAEALGASGDWAEAMERVVRVERPQEPGCEECGGGHGHPLPVDPSDYVQGAYDCTTCGGSPPRQAGGDSVRKAIAKFEAEVLAQADKIRAAREHNAEVVSAPSQAPAAALKGGSGRGEAGHSVGAPQAEWDASTARPQGWEVRCDDCQRASVHDVVPDSVCAECGGEVELLAWPDLEPNARALETIGQLDPKVRVYRPRGEGSKRICQVCNKPIRPGTRFLSPTPVSDSRCTHALCVEALARQEGPV